MTEHLLTSFILLLLLSGCAVQPPAPTEPTPIAREYAQIDELLDQARIAFEADRLTTPLEDNAWSRYMQVLGMDPGNQRAQAGITAIADRYLSWSIEYARDGIFRTARDYLGKAESVDPDNPSIDAVARMINDREQLTVERFVLDPGQVRARESSQPVLEQIAERIVTDRPFVTIRAPDDASGRWIYQQLQARVSFRIEASFAIRPGYSVELSK